MKYFSMVFVKDENTPPGGGSGTGGGGTGSIWDGYNPGVNGGDGEFPPYDNPSDLKVKVTSPYLGNEGVILTGVATDDPNSPIRFESELLYWEGNEECGEKDRPYYLVIEVKDEVVLTSYEVLASGNGVSPSPGYTAFKSGTGEYKKTWVLKLAWQDEVVNLFPESIWLPVGAPEKDKWNVCSDLLFTDYNYLVYGLEEYVYEDQGDGTSQWMPISNVDAIEGGDSSYVVSPV